MRGITSKHQFATKNYFESRKKLCENTDFCNVFIAV